MKCPNCGREIAEDSVFCEYCGTKLICKEQEKQSQQSSNEMKSGDGKKIVYVISLVLLNIVSLCVAYSVHWETFAYYGLAYEGYPAAGKYNAIFFICIFLWLCSLIALPFVVYIMKHKKH